MRALRIHEWDGPLRLEDVPEPEVDQGELLVRVEACAIGLTVVNYLRGDLGSDPGDLPRVPGHEIVGRVVATGAGVDPARAGELVAAFFYLFCGRCHACLRGAESLCENFRGFLGVQRDGGFADLVSLPEANAIPLPQELDPVEATAVPDAIATPVHVTGRAGIAPGERVAVVAAGGGLGIHMVQMASAAGASVIGLDVAADKLAFLVDELGVEAIDSSDFGRAALPSAWSGAADVVVDFLGSRASLRWSLDALAPGGRLVVLTTFPGVTFEASPRELVFAESAVLGSRYCSRHELQLAGRLVAEGRIRPMVTRRVPLEGVDSVLADLRRGALLGRGAALIAC